MRLTYSDNPTHVMSGVDPQTGEVVEVCFSGSWPLKDPVTNQFIVDDNGDVVFPKRQRTRNHMLRGGQLVPDPRPVATAIAFAPDIMPEQQVQQMLERAYQEQRARMKAAYEAGIDYYPVDENVEDDLDFEDDDDPRFMSPHELVHDEDAGQHVTRALKGMFKRTQKPATDAKASQAPVDGDAGISES